MLIVCYKRRTFQNLLNQVIMNAHVNTAGIVVDLSWLNSLGQLPLGLINRVLSWNGSQIDKATVSYVDLNKQDPLYTVTNPQIQQIMLSNALLHQYQPFSVED
jgi:hypothetical protein